HRFKTMGMDSGVSTRVLDAIQGHAPRTAWDGYGEVTVKAQADATARIPSNKVCWFGVGAVK
ncbi:MAG TPA: hypothetical protein VGH29_11270, partial [Candidatus Binataceae bacterium]